MRCVIVLIDGLRPDAVSPETSPALSALAAEYTWAEEATTVRPSVTVAALASLATGVAPATHGLLSPGTGFLSRLVALRPLARELSRRDIPAQVMAGTVGPLERSLAGTLIRGAGVSRFQPAGDHAEAIVDVSLPRIRLLRRGLSLVYLADCDRAGHEFGWMSGPYFEALARVDRAMTRLAELTRDSLVVVVSDHGGGGEQERGHDEPHPLNDRITLLLAGPEVAREHRITRPVSLLDIPPTVLAYFEVPVPAGYEGRVIDEAVIGRTAGVAVA
jgi:arylsulfatase A-like enzyme